MLMQKIEKYLSAILAAVVGVLFIVLKGNVIGVAMTIAGVALIVMAVLDLVNRCVSPAIVKAVVGVVIIVFGWVFAQVVLYILAAALVIYGAVSLYNNFRFRVRGLLVWDTVVLYAVPVVWLVLGFLLFFNMGATVNGVIVAAGVIMLIQAVLLFLEALRKKK